MKTLLHNQFAKTCGVIQYNINYFFNEVYFCRSKNYLEIHDNKYFEWFLGFKMETNELRNWFAESKKYTPGVTLNLIMTPPPRRWYNDPAWKEIIQ